MITNSPATSASDIRDIKPPVTIPNVWDWVWWGLGSFAVLAILYFVWRFWQQRRSQIPVEPPVPAHIRAKQKLEDALSLIAQPKPFCILVSDTVRFYLEGQFNFHAPERTTEEFLRELGATDLLSVEQKESLGRFLESCDLVKFAKYEPAENELRELHGAAVRLIEETEPREIQNPEARIQQPEILLAVPKKEPTKGSRFAIIGVILQLCNTVFFFAYIVGIVRELKLLQDLPSKVSQEMSREMAMSFDQLFSAMSQPPEWLGDLQNIWEGVLIASSFGLLVGFIGLVMIFIALIKQRYRAEWFFWFLVIYSGILCAVFPIGTIFGIFFLVYCLTKRAEFFNPT